VQPDGPAAPAPRRRRAAWPSWLSPLNWLGLFAVVGLLGACVVAWKVGGDLVRPTQREVVYPAELETARLDLSTPRGGRIVASFLDAGPESSCVVLLHGVGGCRADMAERARFLRDEGYSSLAVDLPGQGESPGDAMTLGWRESAAARVALGWWREHRPGKPLAAIGTSLGGAALLLGEESGAPAPYDAIVLEAVYDTASHAVFNRIEMRLGGAAYGLSPLLLAQLKPRLGLWPGQLRPVAAIRRVRAPILVIAGENDLHTRLADSKALFAAAPAPKELWVVKGAAHEDFLTAAPVEYPRRVLRFLTRALGAPSVARGHAEARTESPR
jgi:alpha-beta hydrolase superfamily lysophospholipase